MAFEADKLTRIVSWVFDDDQPIAICGSAPMSVKSYDSGGELLWEVADATASGRQVAIGPDSSVVLAYRTDSEFNHIIQKRDEDGALVWSRTIVAFPDPDVTSNFVALCCDTDGNVFYVFGSASPETRFGKLNGGTGAVIWQFEGADYIGVQGIACDPDGNVIVGTLTDGLKKYSGETGSLVWQVGAGAQFADLACDPGGNIFVRKGTPGALSIAKYSTGGASLAERSISGFGRFGIDVDENGEPWFCEDSASSGSEPSPSVTVARFNSGLTQLQASFSFTAATPTVQLSTSIGDDAVVVLDAAALSLYQPNSSGTYVRSWVNELGSMQDLAQRWIE